MLVSVAIIAAILLVAGVAAAPLLVYSATWQHSARHMCCRNCYVDRRFSRDIGTPRLLAIILLLAGAASAREHRPASS